VRGAHHTAAGLHTVRAATARDGADLVVEAQHDVERQHQLARRQALGVGRLHQLTTAREPGREPKSEKRKRKGQGSGEGGPVRRQGR